MSNAAKHHQKLLLFSLLGRQLFAIGTLKIREIIPVGKISRILREHPAVLGVTQVRERSVPVIDMAAAVGATPLTEAETQAGSIIITDCQRRDVGFLVRGIERIIDINWRAVKAPPEMLSQRAFVTGLFMLDNQAIQLLDLELVFAMLYPDSQVQRYPSLTSVEREQLKQLNILLVDDSQVARKQLSDTLDYLNIPYQVTLSGDAALALMLAQAADNNPIDLLVSDVEMPGLDGYELTFAVRDSPVLKHAYVILHTSINSQMSVSYANQVGANEALTKFDATELVQAMLRGAHHLVGN